VRRHLIVACAALAIGASACASQEQARDSVDLGGGAAGSPTSAPTVQAPATHRVDPRAEGFEIGFGEYAVTLEAQAIRPGQVTFVIRNGGKLVHGFEMEGQDQDGDSSGPGSGGDDAFKIERPSFRPGQTIKVPLDITAGVYKIECWVANHDDLGMEILLDVRADAPKVKQPLGGADSSSISIEGFAFQPETASVPAGTELTWTNADPEAHTVTADNDSFDSGPIDPGQSYSVSVDESGAITYFCAIHPSMKGTIQVG
jgi:plastocyanin